MRPVLSIVVPIYKVENYLENCINSILSQTYSDFELILVNDGSPDNCGEICEYYKRKDKRVKIIHKENGGVSSARNKGIEISKGEYIAFVDPDDTIEPNMYEVLLENALHLNADIVVCPIKTINVETSTYSTSSIWKNTNSVIGKKAIEDYIIPSILKNKTFSLVSSVNKLYRKSLFNSFKFEEHKHHSEDARLNFKFLTITNNLVFVEQPLYNYYKHKRESLTQIFRENFYDYIVDNKKLLIEICNSYKLKDYTIYVKNHYTSVTLSYIQEVVKSPLTINEKYKIISTILNDIHFNEDLKGYKCPSFYYKLLKVFCFNKNERLLYKVIFTKNKFQLLLNKF
ncbi:glycosyltransferase [Fictibacillus barbaricus]|uniref:Glycosyltransferase involved in cell wall biosynthesis n=1 Tax=Fictibacillus barbaricus TaxID=182136 RepID=A0ABU1U1L6_9BACL|nr:glycosyltransferase [Fictibacillus barbaricus]MDR7073361.1 glycosyltransferase involved in cell wall biosynthesis [Fictibacillus barbaricus]